MEDEKTQRLRKLIIEIQKDQTLTPQEKAKKIQVLVSGKVEIQSTKSNEFILDTKVTYQDEEKTIMGCKHYQRGCKKLATCCGQLFTCRVCHDDVSDHKIDRYATEQMMCMHCKEIQPINQICQNPKCGQKLARYYCSVCKFHDDTENKNIYHCAQCGLCRIGKGLSIDFFHCEKCNMCYPISDSTSHKCIENNMKSDCPICHTDLFTSRDPVCPMKCGHPIHVHCFREYVEAHNFTCPLCSKSLVDMQHHWEAFDHEIEAQPMPTEFKNTTATILCSDCEKKSEVSFHFVAMKCLECGSYNTKTISTSGFPNQ